MCLKKMQKFEIQSSLLDLYSNEYSQERPSYSLAIRLDRCVGSCNTLNDLFSKVCFPNNTKDLNLSMLNMNTEINEWKTLAKHI